MSKTKSSSWGARGRLIWFEKNKPLMKRKIIAWDKGFFWQINSRKVYGCSIKRDYIKALWCLSWSTLSAAQNKHISSHNNFKDL